MNKTKVVIGAVCAALFACAGGEASAQQQKWLFSSMSPGGSSNSKLFNAWAQRIAAASNGQLTLEVKDGTSLASFVNVFERVQSDILQVGWTFHPMYRDKWPLSEVAGLPFVQDSEYHGSLALWRLYKEGLLDSEYKEVKPVVMALAGNTGLHFAKAPATLDDLGKYKVRVQGAAQAKMAEVLGMSAQSVPAADMYVALQRGTIDAVLTSWSAYVPYKLWEVSNYHVEGPLGTSSHFFFVSRKKYDALPANLRQAFDKVSGDAFMSEFAKHFVDAADEGRTTTMKHSNEHKLVKLSGAQLASWEKKIGQPVIDEWLKGGTDRAKVLARFKQHYADVKAGK